MSEAFFYLSDGKLFLFDGTRETEVHSGILDAYTAKVRASAARTEWKYSGEGARFTGAYRPDASAEDRIAAIHPEITAAQFCDGVLVYALSMNGIAGIYHKRLGEGAEDGIVLSTADASYRDFSVKGEMIAASAFSTGESHIGVCSLDRPDFRIMTEGHTVDTEPVWSREQEDLLFFCSAGLSETKRTEEDDVPQSFPQMLLQAQSAGTQRMLGPSAVCSLSLSDNALTELLSDNRYDYLHPQSTPDGSLYYIRRLYRMPKTDRGGCLSDLLLLPFRLIGALFGFFNLFSMKYSGKPLSHTGDVRQRDETQMRIDGNLIDAEKELRENTAKGEKNPGIIPRSWELHRRAKDGSDTLIRRGICAYRVLENGTVLCSTGNAVIAVRTDGTEEKTAELRNVTRII